MLKEYSRRGVGLRLVEKALDVLQDLDYPLVYGVFTSAFSQKIAQRCGFETVVSRSYTEYKNFERIPEEIKTHQKESCVMVKRLQVCFMTRQQAIPWQCASLVLKREYLYDRTHFDLTQHSQNYTRLLIFLNHLHIIFVVSPILITTLLVEQRAVTRDIREGLTNDVKRIWWQSFLPKVTQSRFLSVYKNASIFSRKNIKKR